MRRGKEIAQGAHAAIGALGKACDADVAKWYKSGTTKICLQVDSEEALIDLLTKAEDIELPACLIHDAGRTEVAPGSITALAIGPADESLIDSITKDLKLY